jgi:hypothetical protein
MDILYQLLGAFNDLPAWTRWVFVVVSVACILGFGAFFTPLVGLIIAGGLLLIAVLVAGFRWWLQRRAARRAAAFGGGMSEQNAGAPAGISDAARRAKLEDLRRNFQSGIEKFNAAGKNLYSLPWYVIIGEPGAGKTEAIRHSSIGFPPGMQDEFQGVGGTINMNWWFTNEAVILDTAGRLIFEEVPPGSTSEWREFLTLLKIHRPNCPINGLLLVLPAESLIKDTGEEIVKKAGRIATQLEVIQKHLDIRFPVYVVIAKCDLLNGFREFFDDLTDEAASHQIAGWSNPDPLDQPFRPELVDAHIQTVALRLTRRRLGLLLDPVARTAPRRVDEVDRLFALPHSIGLIGANLQRYLQTLFMPGEWTSRPLFLRGIYFTSSMREGAALDQELANAMGISVDQLPEGRAWERKRSYFLRDIFAAKAFKEKGLVTTASDTRQLVRRRRFTFFGAAAAGLAALVGFSFFGYRGLQQSIGRQGGYWVRASEGWDGNVWNAILRPDRPLLFRYVGDQPVGPGLSAQSRRLFGGGQQSLADFHGNLRELSDTELRVPWAFRLVSRFGVSVDADRHRAQRIVFEDSVVAPSIAATRERMAGLAPDVRLPLDQARAEAGALLGLVRLEAGVVARREQPGTAVELGAADVLVPLVQYTASQKPGEPLVQTMDWLYTQRADSSQWPAPWVSGGSTLSRNTAINNGLSRFVTSVHETATEQASGYPLLIALTEEVRKYSQIENDLYSTVKLTLPPEKVDERVFVGFSKLQDQRQALDLKLSQARQAGLFGDGPASLQAAYERLLQRGRYQLETALALQKSVASILMASTVGGEVQKVAGELPSHVLFREIQEKLRPAVEELQTRFQQSSLNLDVAELRQLDELYLLDAESGVPHYLSRWKLYEQAIQASPNLHYSATLDLVGADWKPLVAVLAKVDRIAADVANYHGQLSEKAIAICRYSLTRARQIHSSEFCKNYLIQATNKVRSEVRFPFVWSNDFEGASAESAATIDTLLERIKTDLHSANFNAIPPNYKAALVTFSEKLGALDPIRNALFTPDHNLRMCTIVLLPHRQQFELSGQRTGMDFFKAIQIRAGTRTHGAAVKYGTPGLVPTDSPNETILGSFTMFEPFHFHFHKSPADSQIAVDMAAPVRWTAILLPFESQATRLDGGKRWRAALRPAPDKLIWIEFRFVEPLPEFDEWPTFKTLGLEGAR